MLVDDAWWDEDTPYKNREHLEQDKDIIQADRSLYDFWGHKDQDRWSYSEYYD